MNKLIITALLGFGFSFSVLAQTVPAKVSTTSVPILPKVWTGVAGDTSIGAISRKNPLHYLHVGETNEVKGWNKYDSPATLTVMKQEGRHLELQFKNPQYQINEVATLSVDGKQIQIASKEASGLFTIEGDKITGCGYSQGANGLFGHWLASYSAWCDEFTVGTKPPPPSTKTVATLPKVWTGILSATNFGGPTRHVPNHAANIGKDKAVKGLTAHDEAPTITILRQEGRHVEFLYKSDFAETKFVAMLSADGKKMQVSSGYSTGIWTIAEDKISGCTFSRGMDGSFAHWFNNYQAYCVDFVAGTIPPVLPKQVAIIPKKWQGAFSLTAEGAPNILNPWHRGNVGKDKEVEGWNAYDSVAVITVQRQTGRHLELLMQAGKFQNTFVGTLSSDGKQLQMVSNNAAYLLSIAGEKISGCGVARGIDQTFSHWLNSYVAFCYEFTAVK